MNERYKKKRMKFIDMEGYCRSLFPLELERIEAQHDDWEWSILSRCTANLPRSCSLQSQHTTGMSCRTFLRKNMIIPRCNFEIACDLNAAWLMAKLLLHRPQAFGQNISLKESKDADAIVGLEVC